MEQCALCLRMNGKPSNSRDGLVGIRGERLAVGEDIGIPAEVPQKAVLWRITKPLDPVGQYGNGGVVHRKSLNCPARIPHHDLVQREPLFRATDEEVSPEFGNRKHDTRFPKQPGVGRSVVHDPSAPCYVPLETGEGSTEKESEITEPKIGVEGELLFALFV